MANMIILLLLTYVFAVPSNPIYGLDNSWNPAFDMEATTKNSDTFFEAGLRFENAVQHPAGSLTIPFGETKYYFFNLNSTCHNIKGVEVEFFIDGDCAN